MQRTSMKTTSQLSALLFALFAGTLSTADAVTVTLSVTDDSRCDNPPLLADHELGEPPRFPDDEEITKSISTNEMTVCTTNTSNDPTILNDEIAITNRTGTYWDNLWFVADEVGRLSNVDRIINDGDAFKIDDAGNNKPLQMESQKKDLVFEPGETWTFIIQDWNTVAPFFQSLDDTQVPNTGRVGTDSTGDPRSNASIVARSLDTPIENRAQGVGFGVGSLNFVYDSLTETLSVGNALLLDVLNEGGGFLGIDAAFAADPILGATLSVDDFELIGAFEDGLMFHGGFLEVRDGADLFLRAEVPLLFIEDGMRAAFGNNIVAPLRDVFVDLSLGSFFLAEFHDDLLASGTIATELFGLTGVDLEPLIEGGGRLRPDWFFAGGPFGLASVGAECLRTGDSGDRRIGGLESKVETVGVTGLQFSSPFACVPPSTATAWSVDQPSHFVRPMRWSM